MSLGLLLVGLSAGCSGSKGPARYPVQGTVSLDGVPLKSGIIIFRDVANGSLDSATIEEGRYSTQAEAGTRRVEICAYDPNDKPKMEKGVPQIFVPKNLVAEKYNVASTLSAEIKRGENPGLNFEVTSK
ncbi:hypothetical protein SH661x_003073 [Planctomicrobium sp. SH661]|uniref:hypothetical protein n=1 Tax=Planctomicrobium sp. SH661 TaxID=3448124 RepID=UPI003F5C5DA8